MSYIGKKVKVKEFEYSKNRGLDGLEGKITEIKPENGGGYDYRVKMLSVNDYDLFNENELEFIEDEPVKQESESEWLTTGQMLDKILIGQIAEGQSHWEVKMLDDVIVELNSGKPVEIDISFLSEKWRLIPLTVTFEEAKSALQSGIIIECEMPVSKIVTRYIPNGNIISYIGEPITWDKILNGKWSIKK